MTNTIRLIAPDWQAGNREAYFWGAEILSHIIPNKNKQKEIRIDVKEPNDNLEKENGVYGQSQIIENVKKAKNILKEEHPDKIITFGGNCIVSQAPFDYLHQKYDDKLGIIWIDTHPDISTPKDIPNEHAMVVSNLLGKGDSNLSKLVESPIKTGQFLYVGLQEVLDSEKENLQNLNFNYKVQGSDIYNYKEIQRWINKNNFTKIAIHFDIDVLNPKEFYSTYVAEPGLKELPTEAGQMSLNQLNNILQNLSQNNEIVGLTIAEYMPWDAVSLNKSLSGLNIFS